MENLYTFNTKISLNEDQSSLRYNDINLNLSSSISLDGENPYNLKTIVNFSNIAIVNEEIVVDEIMSLLKKIEKYQKGKMSDKEVSKIIKKCDKFDSLNFLKNAFVEKRPLDTQELNILKYATKVTNYKIVKPEAFDIKSALIESEELELSELNLSSLNTILQKELDSIVDTDDFQVLLEVIFDERAEEKRLKQIELIKSISGDSSSSSKSGAKKKVKINIVDEYLKEKQKLIEENADSNYIVDIEFPLPQANNLERILELGQEIFQRGETKINLEVLENDLDKRDVHYYTRALCYLGLAKYDNGTRDLCLSYNGELFFRSSSEDRKDIIFGILNTDDLVKKFINNELDLNNPDHKKEFELRGLVSDSTIMRRLSSLKSWINYLAG